jgi:hypothetical protein
VTDEDIAAVVAGRIAATLGLPAITPRCEDGVVGGDAFTGTAIPEDLLAHIRHYFTIHRTAWGIA